MYGDIKASSQVTKKMIAQRKAVFANSRRRFTQCEDTSGSTKRTFCNLTSQDKDETRNEKCNFVAAKEYDSEAKEPFEKASTTKKAARGESRRESNVQMDSSNDFLDSR